MAAPDGGARAWLNVFATFVIYVTCVGAQYTLGIFLSALVLDTRVTGTRSLAEVSFAASLESACFLLGPLPAGALYARLGPRGVALFGCAVAVCGALLASAADSMPGVYAGFALLGLGCGGPMAASMTAMMSWFNLKRGTASGLAVAGSGVGAVLLAPLLQAQVDAGGWRQALRLLALLLGTTIPACAAVLRHYDAASAGALANDGPRRDVDAAQLTSATVTDGSGIGASPTSDDASPTCVEDAIGRSLPAESATVVVDTFMEWPEDGVVAGGAGAEGGEKAPRAGARKSLAALITTPSLAWFLLYIGTFGGAWFVLIAHLNNAARSTGTSPEDAAFLVSFQGVANTAGRLIIGVGADVLRSHGVTKIMILQMCGVIMSVTTLALAAPAALASAPYKLIYQVLNGLFGGSVASLQAPVVADLVGLENMPAAFGLIHAVQAPLVLLLPPLAGALRAAVGWPAVFAAAGCIVVVSTSALAFIRAPLAGGGPLTLADCCRRRGA